MGYLTSTFISTQLFFPFMKIPFTPNGNFVHATRFPGRISIRLVAGLKHSNVEAGNSI